MELIILLVVLYPLFGRKKKKQKTRQKPSTSKRTSNTNSFGERMDRLSKGDLPYGWSYANREFTGKIEKEYKYFSDAYYSSKRKGIKQEYAALKSLIIYMEDVTKLCKRKGECFAYWASRTVAVPKQIAEHKARLKTLEAKAKTAKK